MRESLPVQSVGTSIEIVEALVALDGAGVTELHEELDLPKATIHDHLRTLEVLGYIVTRGTVYHAGTRFLELAIRRRNNMDVIRASRMELETLADRVNEHVCLTVEEGGVGVIVYNAVGTEAPHLSIPTGTHSPLHSNAAGKAILSCLPERRVETIIAEHGLTAFSEETITDRDELYEELETVRRQGFATNVSERRRGMEAIATPIMGDGQTVVASLSVYGPSNRGEETLFGEDVKRELFKTSDIIEVTYNYELDRGESPYTV